MGGVPSDCCYRSFKDGWMSQCYYLLDFLTKKVIYTFTVYFCFASNNLRFAKLPKLPMNINKKVEGRKEEKERNLSLFQFKDFWIPENIGRILLSYQNIQHQPTNP